MPTITSTGVGSGLDVNNIVSSLMSLERRPLSLLRQQAGTMQTKLSAFGTLKGQVAALGDVAARLADRSAWNAMRVESSLPAAVSLSGSARAAPGQYRMEVHHLAQPQVLATARSWEGAGAVVGTGTLRIELGAGTEKARAFTLEITERNQTLGGIRDAINASGSGVRASIVGSGSEAYLTLRSPDGVNNTMRITVQEPAGGDNTDSLGLSALAFGAEVPDPESAQPPGADDPEAPDPADPDAPASGDPELSASGAPGAPTRRVDNMRETQPARDASFTLNGILLGSPTNTASNVIEGVSLTLRQVTTAPVDLTVAVDTSALRKNVLDFMNAVNTLTRTVQAQTQADGSSSRGPLQADSTALGLLGSLRELLRGEVTGGMAQNLNAAGIAFQRDGSLGTVESRLSALLDRPEELARLFSQAQEGPDVRSRGLAVRLKDWARAISGEQGTLSNRMTSLNGSTKLNQKQQAAMEEKLARTEARLRAQYQRLDSQMGQLNGQVGRMRAALGLNIST